MDKPAYQCSDVALMAACVVDTIESLGVAGYALLQPALPATCEYSLRFFCHKGELARYQARGVDPVGFCGGSGLGNNGGPFRRYSLCCIRLGAPIILIRYWAARLLSPLCLQPQHPPGNEIYRKNGLAMFEVRKYIYGK